MSSVSLRRMIIIADDRMDGIAEKIFMDEEGFKTDKHRGREVAVDEKLWRSRLESSPSE